jgi:O-methyltransferase
MVVQKITRELLRPFRRLSRGHRSSAQSNPSAARQYPPDFTAPEIATVKAVAPYTMTGSERVVGLVRAVEHLVRTGISGDIVECGVWRGGSMMAVALTMMRLGQPNRKLHLFDTFEGMPPSADIDRGHAGRLASENRKTSPWSTPDSWCMAGIDEVKQNLFATGYPSDLLCFVQGRVEETIPQHAPESISLLRLDTDWYESTRHEFEHLYPRLVPGGVLILDDYGFWQGARRATDEYLATVRNPPLLCRIDSCGCIAVKPG